MRNHAAQSGIRTRTAGPISGREHRAQWLTRGSVGIARTADRSWWIE